MASWCLWRSVMTTFENLAELFLNFSPDVGEAPAINHRVEKRTQVNQRQRELIETLSQRIMFNISNHDVDAEKRQVAQHKEHVNPQHGGRRFPVLCHIEWVGWVAGRLVCPLALLHTDPASLVPPEPSEYLDVGNRQDYEAWRNSSHGEYGPSQLRPQPGCPVERGEEPDLGQ